MAMSIEQIRQELKAWESTFKEINGHKPSKKDVDVAPAKIRGLYRDYWTLKNGGTLQDVTSSNRSGPVFRLKRPDFSQNSKLSHLIESRPEVQLSKPKPEAATAESTSAAPNLDDTVPPLGGITPRFQNDTLDNEKTSTGRSQFVSYFHAQSSFEMAVRRQNLCTLACVNLDESGMDSNLDGDDPEDGQDDESDRMNESHDTSVDVSGEVEQDVKTTAFGSRHPELARKRKTKSNTSNTNFVRLDMKHKRYQAKALKRLKGAALKRFLFRQRMRNHRNS